MKTKNINHIRKEIISEKINSKDIYLLKMDLYPHFAIKIGKKTFQGCSYYEEVLSMCKDGLLKKQNKNYYIYM